MSGPKIRFNRNDQPEFHTVLKRRVNNYFVERKISKYANTQMRIKSFVMLSLFLVPYLILVSGLLTQTWMIYGAWVLMGFGSTGIGMSIMHDANHRAYSKSATINSWLAATINFLGSNDASWRIQHNVLHHSFTNIKDGDGDIDNPIMRLSPLQESKWYYKYQAYYTPLAYAIMTLFWLFTDDFDRLYKYKKADLLKTENLTYPRALVNAIFHKAWYLVVFLVLPILWVEIPWWQTVSGFLLMHSISGVFIAFTTQPAHVQGVTSYYDLGKDGRQENNWAIHQLKTTSNFGNCNPVHSWFIGGLDHQIEHHLFPGICHIHYKAISKIVKKTALEFEIPYLEHDSYWDAVKGHIKHLNDLATN